MEPPFERPLYDPRPATRVDSLIDPDAEADVDTVWEQGPLHDLVARGELAVYHHEGYWQNMDTLRDKHVLQALWDKGDAPWRVWDRPAAAADAPRRAARG